MLFALLALGTLSLVMNSTDHLGVCWPGQCVVNSSWIHSGKVVCEGQMLLSAGIVCAGAGRLSMRSAIGCV